MGFPNDPFRDNEFLPSGKWLCATVSTLTLYFALLTFVGLSRHWGFLTSVYDLGVFDQALWNTVHNDFMVMTSVFGQPMNFLGFHFSPLLLAFVPFYSMSEAPEWFVLAQALSISVAGWPLYRLAHVVTGCQRTAFVWLTIYLVNPFVINAAAWDFHPIVLAAPAVTTGMLAIETRRIKLFLGSMIWALLVQEHMGLFVAGFGLLWRVRHGGWRLPLMTMVIGLGYSYLVLAVVMPNLSPLGGHPMLASESGHLARFGWLGSTPADVIGKLVSSPVQVLKVALVDMRGGDYLIVLALPLLGLFLVAPEFILPGLADLGANILSANSMPRSVFSYHSVVLATVMVVAALYGVRRMSIRVHRYTQFQLAGFVAMASWAAGYLLAPIPLPGAANLWQPAQIALLPDPVVEKLDAELRTTQSVSVQANIASFTQFKDVYVFPQKREAVGAVVLRLDSPTTRLTPHDNTQVGSLTHHLQMLPEEYIKTIRGLLESREFGILVWDSPWLVLSRNAPTDRSVVFSVHKRLDYLCAEWQLNTCQSG